MSPTPEMMKAAEETLVVAIKQSQVALNEKLLKAVQNGTAVDYDLDPFIINAIAQLLSTRESEAYERGKKEAWRKAVKAMPKECRDNSCHHYEKLIKSAEDDGVKTEV